MGHDLSRTATKELPIHPLNTLPFSPFCSSCFCVPLSANVKSNQARFSESISAVEALSSDVEGKEILVRFRPIDKALQCYSRCGLGLALFRYCRMVLTKQAVEVVRKHSLSWVGAK